MPSFGVAEDDAARGIIAQCFAGRRVVQVDARAIIRGGGGNSLHNPTTTSRHHRTTGENTMKTKTTTTYRTEEDSMGKLRVPADALYGAQTQRAVDNFPVSGRVMRPAFVRALALIKLAAAETNMELRPAQQKNRHRHRLRRPRSDGRQTRPAFSGGCFPNRVPAPVPI